MARKEDFVPAGPQGKQVEVKKKPQGPPTQQTQAPAGPPTAGYDPASSEFRGLPREFQKAVESGKSSLADAVKDAQSRGVFGQYGGEGDPAGGTAATVAKYQSAGIGGGGGPGGGIADDPENLGGSDAAGGSVDDLIKQQFEGILSGKLGSFPPETVAKMKQALFETTRGQAKASKDVAMADAARTGLFRSGITQRRFQDIDTSMRSQYTQGVRDIMIEKAKADFSDKMQALEMSQRWLDSKRNFYLGKEQIKATIRSAEIQAGATVAAAALGAEATKAAAGMSAGAARHAADLNYKLGMEKINMEKQSLMLHYADIFSQ